MGKVSLLYLQDFRTKNRDLMRNDIVMMFKNSRMLFMRELMGKFLRISDSFFVVYGIYVFSYQASA